MSSINLYHTDCMEFMRGIPDKHYDLAIVDPPYGIGASKYVSYGESIRKFTKYKKKNWDNSIPNDIYFKELFRVSNVQIIWGGNYFELPVSPKWIIWDKKQPDNVSFGQYEMAWSSSEFKGRIFRCSASWNNGGNSRDEKQKTQKSRIHPTQKPVALYKWLLKNYAKKGDKILDTHGGSMSIAIACHDMGFDLDLCELDADYYAAGVKRFEQHKAQLSLFSPAETSTIPTAQPE